MERDARLDFGRCIAALFVVYVHHSVNFLPLYSSIGTAEWHAANITNSIGRVCVPLFIMTSGALVLGKPVGNWPAYMRRRSAATLKPYLFGAVFYLVWQRVAQGSQPESAFAYLKRFVLGDAFFHLYFLFVLLGMYVVAPVLQGLRDVPRQALVGTTAALFALAVVDRHIAPFGLTLGYLSLGTCYVYLPYFLAGHALYRVARLPGRYALPLFVGSTALTAFVVWFAVRRGGIAAADSFVQYNSANVVLQSLGAFCLLLHVRIGGARAKRMIGKLAELTLGIYVLHFAVVTQMATWLGQAVLIPPFWQVLLYPPAGFVVTAVLVRLLHLIPGVKGFV